jgi:hypothetical protein
VLLDALRRAYPDIADRGVRASGSLDARVSPNSMTISIRQLHAEPGGTLVEAAAALLHKLEEGRVRSRPSIAWDGWGEVRTDWLVLGDDNLLDPGDGVAADVALDVLRNEIYLPEKDRTYSIDPLAGGDRPEVLLGALFGSLLDAGLIDHKSRRIISARRALLDGMSTERRDAMTSAFQSGLEQVAEAAPEGPAAVADETAWDGEAPAAVRHLGRDDDIFVGPDRRAVS